MQSCLPAITICARTVVMACYWRNYYKANRTPEQARVKLLFAPYGLSLWKVFIFVIDEFWRSKWFF